MKCNGCYFRCSFCNNAAPSLSWKLASVLSVVCLFGSKYAIVSGLVIADLSFLNSSFSLLFHLNFVSFFVKFLSCVLSVA